MQTKLHECIMDTQLTAQSSQKRIKLCLKDNTMSKHMSSVLWQNSKNLKACSLCLQILIYDILYCFNKFDEDWFMIYIATTPIEN